jgi:hypothetical protein
VRQEFFSSSAEGLMFDLDWGGGVSKGHLLASRCIEGRNLWKNRHDCNNGNPFSKITLMVSSPANIETFPRMVIKVLPPLPPSKFICRTAAFKAIQVADRQFTISKQCFFQGFFLLAKVAIIYRNI